MDKIAEAAKAPLTGENIDQVAKAALSYAEIGLSYGLNLLTAIALAIGGIILSGWVSKVIVKRLEKVEKFDATLVPVLAQISRYAILIFTAIFVLAEFGVQTASIITVLGAAGLAIGLALQGTLQNVAAGLMLLILRPFRRGDYIEVSDASGTVDEIGLFMTRMHTPQNIFVAVPNSKIWSSTITNYSKRPRRRLDMLVGISYDDDIDQAIDLLTKLVKQDKRVIKKPAPYIFVKNMGESSVDIEMRLWSKRQDYWDLRFDLNRAVKYALDEAGISIPYPHRQLVITGAEAGELEVGVKLNNKDNENKASPAGSKSAARNVKSARQAKESGGDNGE